MIHNKWKNLFATNKYLLNNFYYRNEYVTKYNLKNFKLKLKKKLLIWTYINVYNHLQIFDDTRKFILFENFNFTEHIA